MSTFLAFKWCLAHINIFCVTKGMVPQEDISKFRARECLCFRRSYQLGKSLAFTFRFCWASFLMYPAHSASSHYLWLWPLVTWFKWISEPLGHVTGQGMAATSAGSSLFCLSVGGGLDGVRGPEVERWVSGPLTKQVGTNAEAALGDICFRIFCPRWIYAPVSQGSSLRQTVIIYQQEFLHKLVTSN